MRPTREQTQLVQRTFRAIRELERGLGEPVGFRQVGSLRIAATPEREREMQAQFAIARAEGVPVVPIGREDGTSAIDLVPFRADRFGRVDPRSSEFQRRCALARSASHTASPAPVASPATTRVSGHGRDR